MNARLAIAAATTLALLAACASPRPRNGALGDAPRDATAEPPIDVELADLANWRYVEGLLGAPERVLRLTGRRVRITGVLLLADSPNVPEALLYPEAVYEARRAPEVHEIVRVLLPAPPGELLTERVRVIGTFTVSETDRDDSIVDIYQLRAESCTKVDAAPRAENR